MQLLVGPVNKSFSKKHLTPLREAGRVKTFGSDSEQDVQVDNNTGWKEVLQQLPETWRPDAVVLMLPYTVTPSIVWTWPVARIGWAADPDLQWQAYRHVLPLCDLVLGEPAQRSRLQRYVKSRLTALPLARLDPEYWVEAPNPKRPIDLLVVGNLQPSVQRVRLSWLNRLAAVSRRWQVRIESGVSEDAYRALLSQAKVVVEFTRPGHFSCRVLEALAHGAAVLVPKALASETPHWEDGKDWLSYSEDDFEARCADLLDDESRRQSLVERGRAVAASWTWTASWTQLCAAIAQGLDGPHGTPCTLTREQGISAAAWQELYSGAHANAESLAELISLSPSTMPPAINANLAAALELRSAAQPGRESPPIQRSLDWLRRGVQANPESAALALNLAELLLLAGEQTAAAQQARHALRLMTLRPVSEWESASVAHLPPMFDTFRCAWDAALWELEGAAAKLATAHGQLLRWRAHSLLADLTGDSVHAFNAALFQPDQPATQAALGRFLVQHAHPLEAVPPLRAALAANPLDRLAAQGLWDALGAIGDDSGRATLVAERAQLHRVCPRWCLPNRGSHPPRPLKARPTSPSV